MAETTRQELEELEETLARIERKIDHIHREVHRMAVDQATFDAELGALVSAITDLGAAIDAFIASKPAEVDLTAEEAQVQAAAAAVADELAKVSPPPTG